MRLHLVWGRTKAIAASLSDLMMGSSSGWDEKERSGLIFNVQREICRPKSRSTRPGIAQFCERHSGRVRSTAFGWLSSTCPLLEAGRPGWKHGGHRGCKGTEHERELCKAAEKAQTVVSPVGKRGESNTPIIEKKENAGLSLSEFWSKYTSYAQ